MNGTKASVEALVGAVAAAVRGEGLGEVEVVVAPPTAYLSVATGLVGGSGVAVAGQNCHEAASGAFTGETSVEMLGDLGVSWVILGHSERRHVFGEADAQLTKKVAAALKGGLGAIVCVGETLEQREAGRTSEVVLSQLAAFAAGIDSWNRVVVAYEPVWAIGTGKTATPAMAQAVHKEIRGWLQNKIGPADAATIRIIYGGSVSPSNCDALSAEPDINGFLVGGASLKADQFMAIVKSKSGKSKM